MAQLPSITLEFRLPWQTRALLALMQAMRRLAIEWDFGFIRPQIIARCGVWMRVGSKGWRWIRLPL